MTRLQVAEIFESISGEIGGFQQGSPTVFLRLAGCNLECPFCDTAWANKDLDSKHHMSIDHAVGVILEYPWSQLLITGGEPLIQREALQELIFRVRGKRPKMRIQIETNGSLLVDDIHLVDYWVVDCKGQDAMEGVPYSFNPGKILDNNTWVKYLVGSEEDLDSAIGMASVILSQHSLTHRRRARFAISPIIEKVAPEVVIKAILSSMLPISLNLQLHKFIGAR